jgi:hypothetical protein
MSFRTYNWLINSIVEKIAENEGSLGFGIHGFYANQEYLLLSIPEFTVNKMTFNDVIATTTYEDNSRLGAKLLQYGKVTLDYKKKRFYFEPFEVINKCGLSKVPWQIDFTFQNNKMVVGIIWDRTLEAQINLGDEVLSINGIDIQLKNFGELLQFDITDCEELFIELKDIKTGEIKKVEIKRMQLNK